MMNISQSHTEKVVIGIFKWTDNGVCVVRGGSKECKVMDIKRMTKGPNRGFFYFSFFCKGGRWGEGTGQGRASRYSIGLPSYGLHKKLEIYQRDLNPKMSKNTHGW